MIGAAVGLALLVSALLSWDANATTLTGFGTLSSLGASPVSDHGLLVRKTLQMWLRLHLAAQCYQHVFHVQRFGANSIA
jgi:hypothetical protein